MTEAVEDRIPLVEEQLVVAKQDVVSGRVRVSTRTDAVEEIVRMSLKGDTVEVVRVPVDREVDAAPAVRIEGTTTIVPVLEEVLVVEKRLVLKEELHIRRTDVSEEIEVPVTLRKQRAAVERLEGSGETDEEANQ